MLRCKIDSDSSCKQSIQVSIRVLGEQSQAKLNGGLNSWRCCLGGKHPATKAAQNVIDNPMSNPEIAPGIAGRGGFLLALIGSRHLPPRGSVLSSVIAFLGVTLMHASSIFPA
mmetsp:Transcript_7330/g.18353  ORF Transcript_7330/g.18353 Transcript_7330/m.18353 type:complete len:113 (+) Transcript_7330:140-478(+)